MQLDQMQLALPSRDYYLKKVSEVQLKAYHNYMTNVAILLGANPRSAPEEFDRVIAFEKQLANVCPSSRFFMLVKKIVKKTFIF